MKWNIKNPRGRGWCVVTDDGKCLNRDGSLARQYMCFMPSRNEAVFALDRWKIRQLPQLGTQPPTPWKPPGAAKTADRPAQTPLQAATGGAA